MSPSPIVASRASRRAKNSGWIPASSTLLALGSLTDADYFATQAAGGEAGVSTGFGSAIGLCVDSLDSTARYVFGKFSGSLGHLIWITAAGELQAYFTTGSGGSSVARYQLTGQDLGRFHSVIAQHEGSTVALYFDGRRIQATAIVGFSPAAVATFLGRGFGAGNPARYLKVTPPITWRGVASEANLKSLADSFRTGYDWPTSVPGATISHRHSLKDALAGQTVTDGQAAPASLPDTVTAVAADALTKTGAVVVRASDPAADGRKSYGLTGFSNTSNLQTAAGAGFRGNGSGFTIRIPVAFHSLAVVEYLASCANSAATSGWSFLLNNGNLYWYVGDGSAARGVMKTLAAKDLGAPHLLHMVYDGAAVEGFFDGVSVGKSTNGTFGAAAASLPMLLGGLNGGAGVVNYGATQEILYAFAGANHIASGAEVAADFAAWQKSARLADISASKPDADRYEFSLDLAADPTAVPATMVARVGSSPLSRIGTGLTVSRRTERLFGYETSPVFRGGRGWSAANYLACTTTFASAAAAYWIAFAFVVHAKTGGAFQTLVSKASNSTPAGITCYTSSNNALLNFNHGTGATFAAAPTLAIADADVGKVILVGYQWTGAGGVLQAFAKRLRNGGDIAATAFSPHGGQLMVGRHADTTGNPATDNVSVLDVWTGDGNLTLAEYQALYDSYVSEERAIAVPGKTARIWPIGRSGSIASTPDAQGSGETLAAVGAPALSEINARAIAA